MTGEGIFLCAVPRAPVLGVGLKSSRALPNLRFTDGDRAMGGSSCKQCLFPGSLWHIQGAGKMPQVLVLCPIHLGESLCSGKAEGNVWGWSPLAVRVSPASSYLRLDQAAGGR